MRRFAVLVLSAMVSVGCQSANPAQEVALDMAVEQTGCPASVVQGICFHVTITNGGPSTGDGSCTLYGEIHRTVYPGDESTPGQRILVRGLAPGRSMERTAVWAGPARDFYRGICQPGLGL